MDHQSAPGWVGEYRGQYRDIASCMQRSTQEKVIVRADFDDEARKAYLAVFPPSYYAMEVHEIMVQQVEADTVLIELRFWPAIDFGETEEHVAFLAKGCELST